MANPQYGAKGQHRLIDDDTDAAPILIQAADPATGAAVADASIYVSPKVTDISIKASAKMEEVAGVQGDIVGIGISNEFIDITFTLMPHGSTKANALMSTFIFRVGAPVIISQAPIYKALGHETAAGLYADLLNTGTSSVAFVQSHDMKYSTGSYTTGTITVRRYPGITTVARGVPIA